MDDEHHENDPDDIHGSRHRGMVATPTCEGELGRAGPRGPELGPSTDELSVDAQLRDMKIRAGARGAAVTTVKQVLIVLILVAGAVAIVRSFVMTPEARSTSGRLPVHRTEAPPR